MFTRLPVVARSVRGYATQPTGSDFLSSLMKRIDNLNVEIKKKKDAAPTPSLEPLKKTHHKAKVHKAQPASPALANLRLLRLTARRSPQWTILWRATDSTSETPKRAETPKGQMQVELEIETTSRTESCLDSLTPAQDPTIPSLRDRTEETLQPEAQSRRNPQRTPQRPLLLKSNVETALDLRLKPAGVEQTELVAIELQVLFPWRPLSLCH